MVATGRADDMSGGVMAIQKRFMYSETGVLRNIFEVLALRVLRECVAQGCQGDSTRIKASACAACLRGLRQRKIAGQKFEFSWPPLEISCGTGLAQCV